MEKKIKFASLIIIFFTLLSGCTIIDESSKITLDNLPSGKKFWDLSIEDRMFTVNLISQISAEECEELMEKDIEELLDSKPEIKTENVIVTEDKLTVDRYGNKPFANFVADITFKVEKLEGSLMEIEDFLEETGHQLYIAFDSLDRALLYNRKVYKMNMNFLDKSGKLIFEMVMNPVMAGVIPEEFVVKLTEEEATAQNLAFEYTSLLAVKESPEDPYRSFAPLLNKFGIIESEKVLFVEIEIIDKYYLEDDIPSILDYFEVKSNELIQKLLSDTKSIKFIKDNKAEKITVSFYVPWIDEEFLVFEHLII